MASGYKLTDFLLGSDGNCRLVVNEEGWLNAGEASRKRGNPVSNVISLLGRTHAGKSFICGELLRNLGIGFGPASAAREAMAPTSSDVVAYEGIMKSETAVRFLDCEGEGGRVAPEELVDRCVCAVSFLSQRASPAHNAF
jgi:hypothetical protein